ncbi:MAG: tRNA 2-thiouridine(34) synthase MnmA, partial [Spirochaetia bacterium]|nr:tRNA 2-thiouridine(34) synthase MnmA [Spirochaetia bacterium]
MEHEIWNLELKKQGIKMAKILAGMSGGVDSTMAAALLKKQGHEVIGITLKLWDDASRCCNAADILDAGLACRKIGIRHYVLNYKKDFKKYVVDYFTDSYLKGITPNPCVICNEEVKFRALFEKMRELDFDMVTTGHYARITVKHGVPFLCPGRDRTKSQEYFLSRLTAEKLKYIIFPLGGHKKKDIISMAKEAGLYVKKPESQEACFLRRNETPFEFIKRSTGVET